MDELHAGLSTFLAQRCGKPVSVTGLRRLTGGTSHETWAFELCIDSRLSSPRSLILRRDFSKDLLDLDLATEFALLQRLYAAGVPVPEPLFCEHENSPLTTPFIISERFSGTDIRKQMARDGSGAKELALKLVAIQAQIHNVDWRRVLRGVLPPPDGDAIAIQMLRWSQIATECSRESQPLLSAAIDWLDAHPPGESLLTLVHGDFKTNNLVLDRSGRVAVIDWELSHIGDPLEDLAFTMLWTSQYDLVGGILSEEDYIAAYEAETGSRVDRERLFYWQMFSLVKIAAIFMKGMSATAANASIRPSLIMLDRAIPWVERRAATLLRFALTERQSA
jgi:aminoglycoside phosphotransferase (APT) family kinase protein